MSCIVSEHFHCAPLPWTDHTNQHEQNGVCFASATVFVERDIIDQELNQSTDDDEKNGDESLMIEKMRRMKSDRNQAEKSQQLKNQRSRRDLRKEMNNYGHH